MKKQLLLSAVALFSVVGVSAQLATITQEWKTPVGDATNKSNLLLTIYNLQFLCSTTARLIVNCQPSIPN